MTVSVFRGILTLMFLRLCWRAPETVISSNMDINAILHEMRQPTLRLRARPLHHCNRHDPTADRLSSRTDAFAGWRTRSRQAPRRSVALAAAGIQPFTVAELHP